VTERIDSGEIPDPAPVAAPEVEILVGARLRAAREEQGLSVGDVAQRLKFAPRQIEALEADQYVALPGLTFVRGFVRSYAKLLGLDGTPLVAALERMAAREARESGPSTVQLQHVTATPARFPTRSSAGAGWPWMVAMVVAVVGIGGFTLYQWQAPEAVSHPSAPAPAPVEPVLAPAPAAPAEPAGAPTVTPAPAMPAEPSASTAAPAPPAGASAPPAAVPAPPAKTEAPADASKGEAGSGKIHLVFSKESWTEVRQGNGQVVFSRQSAPGTDAWLDGQPPFDFVIGNADSVKLFYRGNPVDLAPYIKVSVARLQLK
jgi:cytoskeleton protein RodZ